MAYLLIIMSAPSPIPCQIPHTTHIIRYNLSNRLPACFMSMLKYYFQISRLRTKQPAPLRQLSSQYKTKLCERLILTSAPLQHVHNAAAKLKLRRVKNVLACVKNHQGKFNLYHTSLKESHWLQIESCVTLKLAKFS